MLSQAPGAQHAAAAQLAAQCAALQAEAARVDAVLQQQERVTAVRQQVDGCEAALRRVESALRDAETTLVRNREGGTPGPLLLHTGDAGDPRPAQAGCAKAEPWQR